MRDDESREHLARRAGAFAVLLCAIPVLGAIGGCTESSGPSEVEQGTVVVDPEPDSADAPWQLSGPGSYSHSDTGDETLSKMEVGAYTLTWGVVAGYVTPSPNPETRTLQAGATLEFAGTYVEEGETGTVVVDAEPDVLNAPWQLFGPGSYSHSGSGDQTLSDVEVGAYTLCWGSVAGYVPPSPNPETQTLEADGTVTFQGTYVEESWPEPPEMVAVPAGGGSFFIRGDGVAHCGEDTRPVFLTRDFYLGRYEVDKPGVHGGVAVGLLQRVRQSHDVLRLGHSGRELGRATGSRRRRLRDRILR